MDAKPIVESTVITFEFGEDASITLELPVIEKFPTIVGNESSYPTNNKSL